MKKGFKTFVTVFFLLFIALITASCAVSHVHKFSEEWTYNASEHWHKATCEHTEEVSDKAAHSFGGWVVKTQATETSEGVEERVCSVCGYTETRITEKTAHVHTFSDAWSYNETDHWHPATCDHKDVIDGKEAHSFGDWEILTEPGYGVNGLKKHTCTVCGYEEVVDIPAREYFITSEVLDAVKTAFSLNEATISISTIGENDTPEVRTINIKDQKAKVTLGDNVTYYAVKASVLYSYTDTYNYLEEMLTTEECHLLGNTGINVGSFLIYDMDSELNIAEYFTADKFDFTYDSDTASYLITRKDTPSTIDNYESESDWLKVCIDLAKYVTISPAGIVIGASYPDADLEYTISIVPACDDIVIPTHEHIYSEDWTDAGEDADGHYHQALCPDGEALHDLTPHSYGEWEIVDEAKYGVAGLKKHTCEVCGHVEYEVIPARTYYLSEELLKLIRDMFNGDLGGMHREAYFAGESDYIIDVYLKNGIAKVVVNGNLATYLTIKNNKAYEYEASYNFSEEEVNQNKASLFSNGINLASLSRYLFETNVDFDTLFTSDKFELTYDKETAKYTVTRKDTPLTVTEFIELITSQDPDVFDELDYLAAYIDLAQFVEVTSEGIVITANYEEEKFNYKFVLLFNSEEHTIPEHTHIYEDEWSCDEHGHWHYPICPCGEEHHDYGVHTFGEWVIDEEATELQAGLKHRTCEVCGCEEYETIPRIGELFKEFAWSSDYETAEALYETGTGDIVRYPATVKKNVVTYCDKKGTITYTATYGEYKDTQTVELAPTGHKWGDVVYTWSDDNKTCTATRICQNDSSHVETENAKITEEVIPLTCTQDGKTILTATFDNPEFKTQTKEINVTPATGHDYEVTFVWNEDNTDVSIRLVCKNDPSHVRSVDAHVIPTSEVTKPSTCTVLGERTYTATFDVNLSDYGIAETHFVDTKVVEEPLAPHNYKLDLNSCSYDEATSKATIVEKCSECGDERVTENVELSDYRIAEVGSLVLVSSKVTKVESENGVITKMYFEEFVNGKPFILYKPQYTFPAFANDTVYAVGYVTNHKGQYELDENCVIVHIDSPVYNVTFDNTLNYVDCIVDGVLEEVMTDGKAVNGTTLEFTVSPKDDTKELRQLFINDALVTPNGEHYELFINSDTTIRAVLRDKSAVVKYVKATNADYLFDGMEVIFANETASKVSSSYGSNRFGASIVEFDSNGCVPKDDSFILITLKKAEDKWYIVLNGNQYIKGGSAGKINIAESIDDATKWTISFDENGNCLLKYVDNSGNSPVDFYLQYNKQGNTSGTWFANYKNNQEKIQLYVYTENYNTTVIAETEPTCEHEGYHASYKIGDKYYDNPYGFGDELVGAVIPALGHQYPNPADVSADSWNWADDRSSVTLTLVCVREGCVDDNHEVSISVTSTATELGAIVLEAGVYTATIHFNGRDYTSSKTADKEKFSVIIVKDEHVESVVVKNGENVVDDLTQIEEGTVLNVLVTATDGYAILSSTRTGSSSNQGSSFEFTLAENTTITVVSAELHSSSMSNQNADIINSENNAKALGINYVMFTAIVEKNNGSSNVTKAPDLRLYPGSTNGGSVLITAKYGIISKISITYTKSEPVVLVGNEPISMQNDFYVINSSSFMIQNQVNASSGSDNQCRITNLIIYYIVTDVEGYNSAMEDYYLEINADKFADSYSDSQEPISVTNGVVVSSITLNDVEVINDNNEYVSYNNNQVTINKSEETEDINVKIVLTINEKNKEVSFVLNHIDYDTILSSALASIRDSYNDNGEVALESNVSLSSVKVGEEDAVNPLITFENSKLIISRNETESDIVYNVVLAYKDKTSSPKEVTIKKYVLKTPDDLISEAVAEFAATYSTDASVDVLNGVTVTVDETSEYITIDSGKKEVSFVENKTYSDVVLTLRFNLDGGTEQVKTITLLRLIDLTDELTYSDFAATNTTYTVFSNVVENATYSGKTAKGNSAIQISNSSPNGIVTTDTIGVIKEITIDWNSNTSQKGRSVIVYGKNTSYSDSSELYDNESKGTKIAELSYKTSTQATEDVYKSFASDTTRYSYIGITIGGGAAYLNKITIVWTTHATTPTA